MSHSLNNLEIRQLLAKWSNGTLLPEDGEKLSHAIETNREARMLYLEYVSVESELLATHAGSSLNKIHKLLEEQLELDQSSDLAFLEQFDDQLSPISSGTIPVGPAKPQPATSQSDTPQPATSRLAQSQVYEEMLDDRMWRSRFTSFTKFSWRDSGAWLLAASVAALATIVGLSQLSSDKSSDARHLAQHESLANEIPNAELLNNQLHESLPAANANKANAEQVIARVTASRNCRWANPSMAIGYGAELVAGQQLHLAAGLAEITFSDGAQVILEGPAKLNLSANRESVLLSGRLAATMPPGFEVIPVRTTRMGVSGSRSLEGLGSEGLGNKGAGLHIGLSADSDGGEEVHVFHGKVQAFLMGDMSDERSLRVDLVSREAAQIKPASTTVAKIFANRDLFVQSISSTGGPQDGLYAYEGFDYPQGPLSGQNGGFGWAGAWADIEAACPPGQLATNIAMEGNLNFGKMRAIGGHASQIKQQNRIRRALSTSLGGVFDSASLVENQDGQRLVGANGKTIYLSFLQQVSQTDDGFYGVELHRGDGNSNRVFCMGNGVDGAGYGVTSNFNAYGKLNYQRLGRETTDVNFIVVKIEFGPFNSDQVTVYRNPDSLLVEDVSLRDAVLQGNFAFDRISFGNFDGTKEHGIDEIRIGTTYRAVTGLRDRGDERLTPSFALKRQQYPARQVEYKDPLLLAAQSMRMDQFNVIKYDQLMKATRFASNE